MHARGLLRMRMLAIAFDSAGWKEELAVETLILSKIAERNDDGNRARHVLGRTRTYGQRVRTLTARLAIHAFSCLIS